MLTRKKIFTYTAAAAIIVRIIFAVLFKISFFDNYHTVPGLDMQTLLRYSDWSSESPYPPFFTFHRLAVFLCRIICGADQCVWAVFILQAIIGVIGTLALTDIILKLTGKRKAALIGGIIYCAYLPLLIYEFSILKETFAVNFALFTFWAMLYALKKRFSWKSSLLLGFAAFAAIEGRLAVMPYLGCLAIFCMIKMFRRKQFLRIFRAAWLPVVLLIAASLFNFHNGWHFSPFFNIVDYTIAHNVEAADHADDIAAPNDTSRAEGILLTAEAAVKRVPTLFKYGELPENHNIYFWCKKIPELHLFPAPGLIIPLAAAGIMLLLFANIKQQQFYLPLLPIITLALPLCARAPIGRYRLMLIPYLFIIIACAAVSFFKQKNPSKRAILLLAAACGTFFSLYNGDVPQRIRPFDHSAYAMAMENSDDAKTADIVEEYLKCYFADPESEHSFAMVMDKLIQFQQFENAIRLAQKAANTNAVNPDLITFYRALIFASCNQPEQTEFQLRQIQNVRSLPPHAYKNAFMLRDWAADALKKHNP